MPANETYNAVINSARISTADGFLAPSLDLRFDGYGIGVGGYMTYNPNKGKEDQKDLTGFMVSKLMQVAGVTEWSQMVGKPVRVRIENNGFKAIGHFMENLWFTPSEDFK